MAKGCLLSGTHRATPLPPVLQAVRLICRDPFGAPIHGRGINITLGLPIIRTSVDHGTALALAAAAVRRATSLKRRREPPESLTP
ncbi:MAG: 4-hydroxythreonine-4-phosphate dehydrogenase PdxA [Betaproteobacteria bacterium]|nr:4-hydroxythreonine-4-phosphate dehydrogenase PdxA [Betaproteobacteria bacterium]